MPAPAGLRPRERGIALAAAAAVQAGLALVLLSGFRVDIVHARDVVEQLVDFRLEPLPPPVKPPPKPKARAQAAAPAPRAAQPGGTPGPSPHGQVVTAKVAVVPTTAAPAGGGAGLGASQGRGSGGAGGTGGAGDEDQGGTDLEQIAGAILPSDYPRHLREAGIGGRVGILFTVGSDGRVTRCSITRSSGVPELDALTCRLIQQRFRYRPSTDRYGRPIADEVEGEHDWIARQR